MCNVIFNVANVGTSSSVLATVNEEEGQPALLAPMLSKNHKPEDPTETERCVAFMHVLESIIVVHYQ